VGKNKKGRRGLLGGGKVFPDCGGATPKMGFLKNSEASGTPRAPRLVDVFALLKKNNLTKKQTPQMCISGGRADRASFSATGKILGEKRRTGKTERGRRTQAPGTGKNKPRKKIQKKKTPPPKKKTPGGGKKKKNKKTKKKKKKKKKKKYTQKKKKRKKKKNKNTPPRKKKTKKKKEREKTRLLAFPAFAPAFWKNPPRGRGGGRERAGFLPGMNSGFRGQTVGIFFGGGKKQVQKAFFGRF